MNDSQLDLTDFTQIGMGFTLPSKDGQTIPKDELSSAHDDLEKDMKNFFKNEMVTIIYKPDPKYENPDTTGNGIMLSGEKLDPDYSMELLVGNQELSGDHVINKLVKKINFNIKFTLTQMKKYQKLFSVDIHDDRKVHNITTSICKILQTKLSLHYIYGMKFKHFSDILVILKNLHKGASIIRHDDYKTLYTALHYIDPPFMSQNEKNFVKDGERDTISDTFFAKWKDYDKIRKTMEDCFGLERNHGVKMAVQLFGGAPTTSFDPKKPDAVAFFPEWCASYPEIMAFIDNKFDVDGTTIHESDMDKFIEFYQFLIMYVCSINSIMLAITEDMGKLFKLIEPELEKLDNDCCFFNQKSLIYGIEEKNPWCSSDYHLLKEIKNGMGTDDKTRKIIAMHNKYVRPNDLFLFLGDISEGEYFDQNKVDIIQLLGKLVKTLNGRKIMIIGNNDTGPVELYKKIGFDEVYDRPILGKKYLFSHEPHLMAEYPTYLNIHGHIHGCKIYLDQPPEKHIDVFYGLYMQPMKLDEIVKYYKDGKYKAKTQKGHWLDPNLRTEPIKIYE